MGSIPIARSNALVFMISCKFQVPSELLTRIDALYEDDKFSNISVFENAELGFSERLDENGFPIAKFFDVEILVNTEENARQVQQYLSKRFGDKMRCFSYSSLKNEDWIKTYLSELKPVICDNFYFFNETIQPLPNQETPENANLIPIRLNSALIMAKCKTYWHRYRCRSGSNNK